jgi:hypothetical protein
MISPATMNLKPAVIELDIGPGSKCPLWVISGHVQCKTACPLYPHVWTYMDPARLQQVDGIRFNGHNC